MTRLASRGREWVDSPLDTYFAQIKSTPLLDADEERDLARRVRAGDAEARDQMVRANLRLVVSVARRFLGRGLGLQDLIEEGNIGLLKAVGRYDPERGVRFSTYATFWVKQAIRMALINTTRTIRVPPHAVALLTQWDRAATQLHEKLGRPARYEEIVRSLNITSKELALLRQAQRICDATMLSDQEGDSEVSLDEMVVDHRCEAPDRDLVQADTARRIRGLLNELEEREATVLKLRFGLADEQPKTLRTIGDRLGLTYERVRQIESKALNKLGARLRAG